MPPIMLSNKKENFKFWHISANSRCFASWSTKSQQGRQTSPSWVWIRTIFSKPRWSSRATSKCSTCNSKCFFKSSKTKSVQSQQVSSLLKLRLLIPCQTKGLPRSSKVVIRQETSLSKSMTLLKSTMDYQTITNSSYHNSSKIRSKLLKERIKENWPKLQWVTKRISTICNKDLLLPSSVKYSRHRLNKISIM